MVTNILTYLENTANNKSGSIVDEFGSCSYNELLNNSKAIGSFLVEKTDINKPIIVFMDKGIAALSSFFGIVYAGCYYILLNPDLPLARLNMIRDVLNSNIIITNKQYEDLAYEVFDKDKIFNVEELKNTHINQNKLDLIRGLTIDSDPLYVNFTSGSTGVPKGVVISHKNVIDFIEVYTEIFDITKSDVIANQAPFDFDVSVKDIYSAIKTGASLVIVPKALFSQPVKLLDFLCDNNITIMTWAVSALCLITTFHGLDYKTPKTVKKILFSGEVMPMKHLKNWMEHLPQTQFVNLYGPTEITCNCTYHIIDRNRDYEKGIPVGKAFPNERIYLIDDNNKIITDIDKTGEICVSGTSVGLGYYNSESISKDKFIQNPVNDIFYERIYKTGDLGSYNDEYEILFHGRKDFQIKYKGHRIELEEIEKAISAIDGIERACCIFDSEKSKLYAYYIGGIDKKELHKKLSETLPVFMIPGRLVKVDDLPLTKNGKIDRKELLAKLGEK